MLGVGMFCCLCPQALYAISGVCSAWRAAVRYLSWGPRLWQQFQTIVHREQLLCLVSRVG